MRAARPPKPRFPAVEAALHEMAGGHSDADVYAEAEARVMESYRRRLEGHTGAEDALRVRRGDECERKLRRAALRAERDQPFALARAHEISGDVARRLVRDVDLQEGRFV